MSKATYAIKNGDNLTGIMWENDKLGKVFIQKEDIDPNFDLEVIDLDNGKIVKHVDLRDFLLEALFVDTEK